MEKNEKTIKRMYNVISKEFFFDSKLYNNDMLQSICYNLMLCEWGLGNKDYLKKFIEKEVDKNVILPMVSCCSILSNNLAKDILRGNLGFQFADEISAYQSIIGRLIGKYNEL